jgi:hypothetical protein
MTWIGYIVAFLAGGLTMALGLGLALVNRHHRDEQQQLHGGASDGYAAELHAIGADITMTDATGRLRVLVDQVRELNGPAAGGDR